VVLFRTIAVYMCLYCYYYPLMVRELRAHAEGSFYHVRSRGNAKQDIFQDDGDRILFLDFLRDSIQRHEWICHGYCLMDNHYHMLIETPQDNLIEGMRDLTQRFTQSMNFKHSRTGHLFQGRYWSKLIEDDDYFLTVSRYVALNPVAVGLVEHPSDWPWSNYNDTCSKTGMSSRTFLTTSLVLSFFSGGKSDPREGYQTFIEDGIESARKSRLPRPGLNALINTNGSRLNREISICAACREHGYSQREIARYLGVQHTTISRILKKYPEKAPLGSDPSGAS
jgi:putative transposase